jgi:hypothetical protein
VPKGPRMMLSRRPQPTAPPAPTAPVPLDPADPALQEDLEVACLDALRGDPPSVGVARRLEHACRGVLAQYGVSGAEVSATSTRRGTAVRIRLPAAGDTVRDVVLEIG